MARKKATQSRRKRTQQDLNRLDYLAKAEYDRQQLERHQAAKLAEMAKKRAALAAAISQLENLLHEALDHDSYIDLESLKKSPDAPLFEGKRPRRLSYLPEPLSRADALKPWKRAEYQAAVHKAEEAFKSNQAAFLESQREHKAAVAREKQAAEEHNQDIEQFILDYAEGLPAAISRYLRLALEGGVCLPGFPNDFDLEYQAETGELSISYRLPALEVIPAIASYAFDRDTGEIAANAMPPKQRGQLYLMTLARVCLRALHALFSADRTANLDSIAFRGYVDALNPSTGNPGRFCLIAIRVTRQQFSGLALEHVEPLACLRGLNARLSAKPEALLPVPASGQEDPPQFQEDESVQLNQQIQALESANQAQGKRIKALRSEKQAQTERISELESAVQAKDNQIAELEGWLETIRKQEAALREALSEKRTQLSASEGLVESHESQLADVLPALREEKARNADLTSEVQAQRLYIAVLEGKLNARSHDLGAPEAPEAPEDETLDETQPIPALDAVEPGEGEIFTPIGDAQPRDESADMPIPPRETLPDRESLHVMALFNEADGEYVDYIGEQLPKPIIDRLAREAKLERHKYHSYKLRATPAGLNWYREMLSELELIDTMGASQPAQAESAPAGTATLGELLRGDAGSQQLTDRPAGTPDDLLTDLDELVTIMGAAGSNTARLIRAIMDSGWACSHKALEARFKQDGEFTFANNIIDLINDRANEQIGDPLIVEEGDQWVIDEEFRDEIQHVFAHPDYAKQAQSD